MAGEGPRAWRRRGLIAAGLGLVLALPTLTPALDYANRLGIDYLLPLRHAAFGPLFPAASSDVVAVVIDEETYGTKPFSQTSRLPLLGREIAKLAVKQAQPGLSMRPAAPPRTARGTSSIGRRPDATQRRPTSSR